ncbi:GHKL domain-containing protein [Bifidobacterium lemurum]|uniref:GHKL domain-containing protein n=1 Tax=Bifidobacterium lemurum TaxID=1603886 RepID=A0A261FKN9_9BIFI|nr:GHKL domain-containing protein [Bifidobacterium lemurum]OZG59740.1 GHKL domain-containing protein [Bifidobacterium lemurum]QOL35033.1 sensor histidine kinase [Bifidobacterium lemurum]
MIASFNLFMLLLVVGAALFCRGHVWRRSWRLLAAPAAVLAYGCIYAPLVLPWDIAAPTTVGVLVKSAYFGLCFLTVVALVRWCTDMTWLESLITAVAGYAVQHIAYDVVSIVIPPRPDQMGGSPVGTIATLAVFAVVYGAAYLLLGRRFAFAEDKIRSRWVWVCAGIGIMVFANVFSLVFVQRRLEETQFVGSFYDALCMMLALAVLMLGSANDRLHGDLVVMQEADRLKAEHYELAKENIELINIKCHDIRKSFSELYAQTGGRPSEASIREIENSIRVYDSVFHTGSDSLDVLLTEKSLYCSGKGITLTCLADGHALVFMEDSDLYSLFGNLLDNAIESAQQVDDAGRRVIDLNVEANANLLVIQEENYFAPEHAPVFRDGLPVTTKSDTRHHGFGTRSIAMQVRKYHGEMTMEARDGVFSVSIVIPIPPAYR